MEKALIAACDKLNRPQHQPHSKLLTWEKVNELRRRVAEGEQQSKLAAKLGISRGLCCQIVNEQIWNPNLYKREAPLRAQAERRGVRVWHRGGKPVKNFKRMWRELFELAGLTFGRKLGLTWHTIRHEFVSRHIENTGDLDLIRFGGHLPKGGYDVQTDGRHLRAAAPAPTVRF